MKILETIASHHSLLSMLLVKSLALSFKISKPYLIYIKLLNLWRGSIELDGKAQRLVLWKFNLMRDSVISVVVVLNKPFVGVFSNKRFIFFLRKNSNLRTVLFYYTTSCKSRQSRDFQPYISRNTSTIDTLQ